MKEIVRKLIQVTVILLQELNQEMYNGMGEILKLL